MAASLAFVGAECGPVRLLDPSAMQLPKATENDAVDAEGRRIDELAVHIMRRMQRPLESQG